jgi:hypothetical protein
VRTDKADVADAILCFVRWIVQLIYSMSKIYLWPRTHDRLALHSQLGTR